LGIPTKRLWSVGKKRCGGLDDRNLRNDHRHDGRKDLTVKKYLE
jgi:hypothetical protein